jgi:hypothetical protein
LGPLRKECVYWMTVMLMRKKEYIAGSSDLGEIYEKY